MADVIRLRDRRVLSRNPASQRKLRVVADSKLHRKIMISAYLDWACPYFGVRPDAALVKRLQALDLTTTLKGARR